MLYKLTVLDINLDLSVKKGLDNARVRRITARCHSLVEMLDLSYKKTLNLRQTVHLQIPRHPLTADTCDMTDNLECPEHIYMVSMY